MSTCQFDLSRELVEGGSKSSDAVWVSEVQCYRKLTPIKKPVPTSEITVPKV